MSGITVRVDEHKISTQDNVLLYATLYSPSDAHLCNDRAVVIAPELGITQNHYEAYARFLVGFGYAVLTFDYRGTGASRQGGSVRDDEATLQAWGWQDMQAVILWLERMLPAHQFFVVAHGISGALVGLTDEAKQIHGILGIASPMAQVAHWPVHLRLPAWLMWNLIIPLSTRLAGYFPAGVFGMGEAVPQGVATEWAQAARTEGHFNAIIPTSRIHFTEFEGYIGLLSFSDDGMAPERAVDALETLYSNGKLTLRKHINKRDLGVEEIGHLGFFREEFRDTLWQESLAWLSYPQRKPSDQSTPEMEVVSA